MGKILSNFTDGILMRNLLAALFLLTLFTSYLYAQTVKQINFDGIVHISKPVAMRMLSFEVGDDINVEDVDKAIKKYFEQGYFNDIWTEFDDGI
jgi:outer membrane protein insertion porin family